ncbi:MAG TPA: DoxX family membrane protein [Pilimelia sp.]|nr:DoxX family membrane protein [Pilimelia sp.]
MTPVRTAARVLLSGIFIAGGARALANPERLVPQAKPITDRVGPLLGRVDPRLPTDTSALVRVNGATQLLGGLLLATGHLTRPAAAVLAGSLVPTTLAAHSFWNEAAAPDRRLHQTQFLKNLGLLGGLLLAAADTEGKPGLRWRAEHAADRTQRSVRRTQRSVRRMARTARREAKLAAVSATTARRLPG